jgi:hypothetical protein
MSYPTVVKICDETIMQMTRYRLKEPRSFTKDFFWIICSLLLAIKVISFCAVSIQAGGPASERLLFCIPLLQRIGVPSDNLVETLCQKLMFPPNEQKSFKTAVTGAWNLLRASHSMKDQSVLGTAKNFGLFFQNMKEEYNCFEQRGVQRKALLKMFSPGLNRKIAEGLLDNLTSCAAICDALDKDSSAAIINCATMNSKGRPSLVDATKALLESDAEMREAKRLLSADFNGYGWLVKKAVAVKFSVNRERVSEFLLDRVKESFESCQGDADDESSEKGGGALSAIMTVVTICSKDLPAILRRLTVEYFSNREKTFQTRRNVDECQEAGIPFNPAQLAEPGAYLDLAKTILKPIREKYSESYLYMAYILAACNC